MRKNTKKEEEINKNKAFHLLKNGDIVILMPDLVDREIRDGFTFYGPQSPNGGMKDGKVDRVMQCGVFCVENCSYYIPTSFIESVNGRSVLFPNGDSYYIKNNKRGLENARH